MKSNACFLLLVVVISIIGCGKRDTDAIKIGRILSETGNAASYGESERPATILAMEQIAAKGGILGRHLEIILVDDESQSTKGVAAMKKLVSIDKVPAVLGATKSGITLDIAPIANENKVLLLCPLSSQAEITHAGPFVFRVMPSDAFQSRILAEWMMRDGHKNVAALYMVNAWGNGVYKGFEEAFKEMGGTINDVESCTESATDFRAQLVKIKRSKPTALFCATMPYAGGLIVRQLKELGINIPVYGGDAWSVKDFITSAGTAAEGVKYTQPGEYNGKEYQDFASAMMQRFKRTADVNAAGAYDAVNILALCIERTLQNGLPITGDNLRREMEKVKGYRGATGITSFDENGDSIGKEFQKMIVRDGKPTVYTE